jgi:hypothetical protein
MSIPTFPNDVHSQSSTMVIPSVYANTTVPCFNIYMNFSVMDSLGAQEGYTSLLLGVDQDAASTVRKLH